MMHNFKANALQFFKFGIVGIINNIISLIIYYIVILFNQEWYLIGNALGFLISTLNAYIMNSLFVFTQNKRHPPKKYLIRTYVVYISSLGISTLLIYIFVQIIDISEVIAPILSLLITVPYNFLMNRFWIYRK